MDVPYFSADDKCLLLTSASNCIMKFFTTDRHHFYGHIICVKDSKDINIITIREFDDLTMLSYIPVTCKVLVVINYHILTCGCNWSKFFSYLSTAKDIAFIIMIRDQEANVSDTYDKHLVECLLPFFEQVVKMQKVIALTIDFELLQYIEDSFSQQFWDLIASQLDDIHSKTNCKNILFVVGDNVSRFKKNETKMLQLNDRYKV